MWKCRIMFKVLLQEFFWRFPNLISDENYSKLLYWVIFGRKIDLQNPVTFNEHIIVAKLQEEKYDYAQYTDKYEVRKYISEQIGDQYLNKVLGIYNSFDEIEFDHLPTRFALKATHASGFNIIVRDKSKLDREEARAKFDRWMKVNFYYKDREKNYARIQPRILCDEYIQFEDNLVEYKLYCFRGKVKLICQNIDVDGCRYTNVLDENFQPIPVRFGYDQFEYPLSNRKDELKMIAEKVSAIFDFVRVDLYENGGKILFSELTFHSGGGLVPFEPDTFDTEFGNFFKE